MGEMIKFGIKMAFALAAAAAVVTAITVFINLLQAISFVGVIGEVWTVVCAFMPWTATAFNGLFLAVTGIITFRVAIFVWRALTVFNSQLG